MKLIFAVDAIHPPLTGIGRYAWELASGLTQSAVAPDVRFFSHGRFVANPVLATGTPTQPPAAAGWLRGWLAGFGPAVKLYGALAPPLGRWCLRHFQDHLFHSPNYFLPPFAGPSVATVHDLSTLLYPEFHPPARVAHLNASLPKIARQATHLITDSEFVRAQVVEQFGVRPDRVTAIALGVDALFHPRTATQTGPVLGGYGLTHGGYTLCVATLEPRKNVERLVMAHLALPADLRLRWPLVLVGSPGWNSNSLHQRISELQGPGLRYLRYVPQDHLYDLYAGARLFAYVSVYEGFGLPVLEAMASGVPVLTSDGASLDEVAGSACWRVDPLAVDAIRDGLIHTLQDEPWRGEAVVAGLARAAEFTWARCFAQTYRLYQKLCPGTGATAV